MGRRRLRDFAEDNVARHLSSVPSLEEGGGECREGEGVRRGRGRGRGCSVGKERGIAMMIHDPRKTSKH